MRVFLTFLLFSGLFSLLSACHKDCITDCDGLERGVITGIDYRKCIHPCCGGWYIKIGEDTLRAPELPSEFANTLDSEDFPLPVCLRWQPYADPCMGDEITVTAIRRRFP